MASTKGFEPLTVRLEGVCSIQLSYVDSTIILYHIFLKNQVICSGEEKNLRNIKKYAIILIMKKIIYFGTPEISAQLLESLIVAKFQIVAVVTQPDKRVGRKRELVYSPVKEIALKYQIPCYQFDKLRDEYQTLIDLKADVLLTCAYGQILPKALLEAFEFKLNVHASLLPKYRGGSPIQYAIFNRDAITGISLMEMTSKMDAGDVYIQESIAIAEKETTSSLFQKMGKLASSICLKYLNDIFTSKLTKTPQDQSQVSFAYNFDREIEKLDLNQDILKLDAWIRMLLDDIGAYVLLEDKKLKIWDFDIELTNHNYPIGKLIFDQNLKIAVKGGFIILHQLQLEGKKKVASKDFYNGIKSSIDKLIVR